MTPAKLPRTGVQPISVSTRGAVQQLSGAPAPALQEFTVSINRHARLSLRGLPTCSRRQINGNSTSQVLARCRDALVGSGHSPPTSTCLNRLPEQAPFPTAGKLLVFNARYSG